MGVKMTRYRDITTDKDRISAKEVRALQDASRAQPGKFKSGIRDDIEKIKSDLIAAGYVEGEELENWRKNWAFASGWEAEVAEYFLTLRAAGYVIDFRYEPKVFEMYDHPRAKHGMKNRRYEPDFWIQYANESDGHYIEVKGYTTERGLPGGPKIKNFWRCHPELARQMYFIVARDKLPQRQISKWTWVDSSNQFIYIDDIRRHGR